MKPFFSIITCTRNNADFIQQNIDSLSLQTYRNFEHIFIDGKSTDASLEKIKQYRRKFPRQVRLFSQTPRGISAAMNEGISHARGQYLLHLHADDSLHDLDVLKDTSAFLSDHRSLAWIYGQISVVEEDGKEVGIFPKRKILQTASPLLLKYFNFIPHQAVFIKKSVFSQYGEFDESLSSQMDYDLWLRIADHTRWQYLPRVVGNFMIRATSQSSSVLNRRLNRKLQLTVQRRYLPWYQFPLAWTCALLVDLVNTTYRK